MAMAETSRKIFFTSSEPLNHVQIVYIYKAKHTKLIYKYIHKTKFFCIYIYKYKYKYIYIYIYIYVDR